MTSTTPNGQYQTRCLRNPRLDDEGVYSDAAPVEQAKVQLRRAYVVAAVLFAVSLVAAVVPAAVCLASSSSSGSSSSRPLNAGDDAGDWTICWPCSSTSNGGGMCCSTLADADFTCNTITAVKCRQLV